MSAKESVANDEAGIREEQIVDAAPVDHSEAPDNNVPPQAENSPLEAELIDQSDLSYEEMIAALASAEKRADEAKERLLRVHAEMENLRRRTERDLGNAHKYALEKIANELLPVKDSLEMGAASNAGDDANIEKLAEGINLTLTMLSNVMQKHGITEINPVSEKFNPELHQAMSVQEMSGVEPNTVITVFQKGYLLNERLIRPAMVVVSKAGNGGDTENTKLDEMA
ncbi:MAG: nucleotide exchange factor GrpE [Gammaproteobacteria bacterium]|nr:nucleotide exchange factor GrpE [Gammaproteobacteria bacterium]